LSQKQLENIAKTKLQFSNNTLESVKKEIAGTARNMGVLVENSI